MDQHEGDICDPPHHLPGEAALFAVDMVDPQCARAHIFNHGQTEEEPQEVVVRPSQVVEPGKDVS